MALVLGLSISHSTSACVVADGKVKAAVMEERLSRRKFDASFPERSIRKALAIAGVEGKDVDRVAIGALCDAFDPNLAQDGEYRFGTSLVSMAARFFPVWVLGSAPVVRGYRALASRSNQRTFFRKHGGFFRDLGIPEERIRFYDHHSCHTATAYYGSPWRDEMLIFTCDGNGDGYCGTVSLGQNGGWERVVAIPSIHSLGGLYARTTRFLGLKAWQDEYKVMGLAPWGARKKRAQEVYEHFRSMWTVKGLRYRNVVGYAGKSQIAYLNRILRNPRFDFVAYGVQRLLEEVLSQWVKNNVDHYKRRRLGLAGGVFYNIKANKRIVETADPDDIFVFPASGDESSAIGAAYLAHVEIEKERGGPAEIAPIGDVYWGEEIGPAIERAVAEAASSGLQVARAGDIDACVGDLLAANEIVAVCRGRMEFGPRALGNRSILANPGDLGNIERLNDAIKNRDFWMPFGLTVMAEHQERYVVNPKRLASPYMIMAFDTVTDGRSSVAAGIHRADKSVRPQILEPYFNPGYHRILERFHGRTGIGAVVNTSLNLHGEPMVNLPEEAIDVLRRSDLSYLALGDYLVSKS